MAKIKDNESLVKDLMTFSPYGVMGQVFITEAIRKYADLIIASEPWKEQNPFINEQTWRGIAEDVKKRCDEFYNRNRATDDGVSYEENQKGELLNTEGEVSLDTFRRIDLDRKD